MRIDRCVCVALTRALALALAAGTVSGTAFGQSPVLSDSGWTLLPTGGTVPNPFSEYSRQGTASAPTRVNSVIRGVSRAGLSAGVTHDGQAPADSFAYSLAYSRDITISESSTIYLSNMLDGFLNFSGAAGSNNIGAEVTARLVVLRADSTGQYVPTGIEGTLTVPSNQGALPNRNGNQIINNFLRLASGNLDATQGTDYRVVATLRISGAGSDATAVGSAVSIDTRGGVRSGQSATLAVVPQGYSGDSRSAVNVAGAAGYNLSGAGVRVGVVEGNAFAHDSLAGRLVIRNGALNSGEQALQEHALAVSGIIASRSDNAAARGVAPDATIYSSAFRTWASAGAQLDDLYAQGVRVTNMSIGFTPGTEWSGFAPGPMNRWVTDNPMMTIVVSAGNRGEPPPGGSSVLSPAASNSVIAVGAVDRTFRRRAEFSSYSEPGGGRIPDLVAPGEFVLAPGQRDGDGNGHDDDFRRWMIGSDFDAALGPSEGATSGTSFAAPFVTGTVALMQQYASGHNQTHDAQAIDSRVVRSVLMATATTGVQHLDGGAWAQQSTLDPTPGYAGRTTLNVQRSLDLELGAGLLNVGNALDMYARPEARAADNATGQNMRITVTAPTAPASVPMFWDRQEVRPDGGAVCYELGMMAAGSHFRAGLAWLESTIQVAGGGTASYLGQLQLGLFMEGAAEGNVRGFDPANPFADAALCITNETGGTARLIDFDIAQGGSFYLVVINQTALPDSNGPEMYGLSVYVPAPGGAVLLALAGVASVRRRRA